MGCSPSESPSSQTTEGSAPVAAAEEPAKTDAASEKTAQTAPTEAQPAATTEAAPQVIQTAAVAVEGMDCGGCVKETELALKKVEGFKSLKADPQRQQAMISFDPEKTDVAQLVEAINSGTKFKAKAI